MVDFQSHDTHWADEEADESTRDEEDEPDEEAHDHQDHDHQDHDHHDHHDHHGQDVDVVSFAVLTVSSSRTRAEDASGNAAEELLVDAGHEVPVRELVPDDFDRVQATVDRLLTRDGVDAIVTTGGTGVTPDDVTVEAVDPLFDKRLPGFGELFRRLSYDEIGARVVGTRAEAGVSTGVPVFCLPGSENAVRLGVGDVILPDVGHLVGLAEGGRSAGDAAGGHHADDPAGGAEE